MRYKCVDCDFYSPLSSDASTPMTPPQGQCRKNPPTGVLVPRQTLSGQGVSVVTFFPEVAADTWCGEYKPKTPESLN